MEKNVILGVIEDWWSSRGTGEHHGLVTSYDSKKHLGKATLQPKGQETGWMQIGTSHIGKTYGMGFGLQPGSGAGAAGQQSGSGQGGSGGIGDQVIVTFQEHDLLSGRIVQRVHSVQDTPPEIKSGEFRLWTKFKQDDDSGPDAADTGQSKSQGQQIWFKNDSSTNYTDGSGAVIVMDGKGNITTSSV